MKSKLISRGAEALIEKTQKTISKNRISKSYRYPELDKRIIKQRTKKEAKLIERANKIINTPKIISWTENKIFMEFIEGKKLSKFLEKSSEHKEIFKQIGKELSKLHDSGIIHGDLTTSNMILKKDTKKVFFLDFGLGFSSNRLEDKAVDLHLIKEALEAKHPDIANSCFKQILEGYKNSKNYKEVLIRLKKVESRGRYKTLKN